jgi:hypothetical protein
MGEDRLLGVANFRGSYEKLKNNGKASDPLPIV